jgi:prepilin-type N-terminal cleavage/methylation domain-containing protein/prepilin-type processing-associated H-X9-DG protein
MPARRAFTLLELIVVIAIIAVLATLAISSLARSRVSSMQVNCNSNLRTIGAAMNLYTGDHGGDFPATAHTDEAESWVFTLRPYLNNVDEVRICPADPRAAERRKAKGTSYSLNEFIAVPLTDPFGRVKESFCNRSRVLAPVRTITVFIGADGLDLGVSSDHTHSRNWRNWEAVLADVQPDRFHTGTPAPNRDDGSANYLYADGHVEAHDAKWLKSEIESGRNPARPPE